MYICNLVKLIFINFAVTKMKNLTESEKRWKDQPRQSRQKATLGCQGLVSPEEWGNKKAPNSKYSNYTYRT